MEGKRSKKIDRRTFLKGIAASLISVGMLEEIKAEPTGGPEDEYLGFLYDSTNCGGCEACTNACIKYNTLPYEYTEEEKKSKAFKKIPDNFYIARSRTKIRAYKVDGKAYYRKDQCMHCVHPSCVSACPVSAMVKDPETGIVYNKPDVCIGCRYCMVACPFNAIRFEWEKTFPKVVKCTMCKDTYLKDKGTTACVDACPNNALFFGKRKELIAEAKRRFAENPGKYTGKIYGVKGGKTAVLVIAGTDFENIKLPKLDESPAEKTERIQGTLYKGMILPTVVYAAIAYVGYKNYKKHHKEEEEK